MDLKSSQDDRRAGAGHRVHFEALVAVGAPAGDSSFEAESIDVSREGMRLRTAYLPDVGDRLMCRFDGLGLDVSVEAEVTWRRELTRGGEFGVCFLSHDKPTADALRVLCAPPRDPTSEDGSKTSARGARVKLHIEGLASPMKARVRDSDANEVQVGSNLEFLKVGRSVDFEDVDQKCKREAYVDHVKVEIDPATSVPQLVVSLRFDGVLGTVSPRAITPSAGPTRAAPRVSSAVSSSAAPSAAAPSTRALATSPEPPPPAELGAPAEEALDSSDASKSAPALAKQLDASDEGERFVEEPLDQPLEDPSVAPPGAAMTALRSAGARAFGVTSTAMGRVAPAMSLVGTRAKVALDSVVERIRQKRGEHSAARKRPRRTTAPPPSGALRSDGRRLVRDADGTTPEELEPRRSPRRAALVGSAVGLVAVLGVFGGAKALGLGADDGETIPRDVVTATTPEQPAAMPVGVAPPVGGAVATGDVPLFGATPLSTTEQVMPPPPAPGEAARPTATDDEEIAEAAPVEELAREFGRGEVHNPKVLKLKMDGPIAGLSGSEGGNGFTIRVPDRKSLSSVGQLSRKDKRITSVKAVNRADGSEITVRFKDEVPPFQAIAKGDRLEIRVGSDKKVASKGSSSKQKK